MDCLTPNIGALHKILEVLSLHLRSESVTLVVIDSSQCLCLGVSHWHAQERVDIPGEDIRGTAERSLA